MVEWVCSNKMKNKYGEIPPSVYVRSMSTFWGFITFDTLATPSEPAAIRVCFVHHNVVFYHEEV